MKRSRSPKGKQKRFRADWRDAYGQRRRKRFSTAAEAAAYTHEMTEVAKLTKLALQLGRGIALVAPPASGQIRRLLRECYRIADAEALGKKPIASIMLTSAGAIERRGVS